MIIDANSADNGSKWTVEEMILLYNLKKADKSFPEIVEIMRTSQGRRDYTANSLQKKWSQTEWNVVLSEFEKQQFDALETKDKDIERDKIIEDTLSTQDRLVKRELARTDIIIKGIKSSIYRLPKPKSSSLAYSPSTKKTYTDEHIGLVLSDLHIGAAHTLEETGGLGEFNLEIFKRRLDNLKNSILKIRDRHSLMYNIPELHIFCLGDIVAGMEDAGAWSASYLDMDIYDQMVEGWSCLRDFIATMTKAFPKVSFYGIYGNHGRVAKKTQKIYANWDKITYDFLKVALKEYETINWEIPKAWFIQKDILGHNFYLTHGDGIRGQMGIPHYGVQRAEMQVVGMMEDKPDYFILGHFHSPAEMQTNSGRIIMNGSFMGGDLYSIRQLRRCDVPEQKMFGIHKKHGVTWTYNIQLDAED